jgi:hypothetical protein
VTNKAGNELSCSSQEEERQDRCRQDRRLPALRFSARVPHVLADRIRRLRTIPGVGSITALTWALEIGDISRFRTIKNDQLLRTLRRRTKLGGQGDAHAALEAAQQAYPANAGSARCFKTSTRGASTAGASPNRTPTHTETRSEYADSTRRQAHPHAFEHRGGLHYAHLTESHQAAAMMKLEAFKAERMIAEYETHDRILRRCSNPPQVSPHRCILRGMASQRVRIELTHKSLAPYSSLFS